MAASRSPEIESPTAPRDRIASIVLAAGAATRFRGRKQLADLHGRPLLEHALAAAGAIGTDTTVVVLGAYAEEIEVAVDFGSSAVVRCPDWESGPGASLRAGLAALEPTVAAALVTLGDEPFLAAAAARRLIAARRRGAPALRATYRGHPGHPVLIERALFGTFTAPGRPGTPAAILRAAGALEIDCSDLGKPLDVDTRRQLAELAERPARPPSI